MLEKIKITEEELTEAKRIRRTQLRAAAALELATAQVNICQLELAEKYDRPSSWMLDLEAGELQPRQQPPR